MQLFSMKCPACGAPIDSKITSRFVTCEYCGSRFVLDGDGADEFIEDVEADDYEYEGDEDASSLTMEDFAAEACEEFLSMYDNGSSFHNKPKIVRGLEIGDDEDIFIIHDDTMMKSGKNGFAITDQGIYCRDLGEEPNFISWKRFARLDEPKEDSCHVTCGNLHVCYYTDDNDTIPYFVDLYRKLQRHAKRCY